MGAMTIYLIPHQPPAGDGGHELVDGGGAGLEAEVIRGHVHELTVQGVLEDAG